MSVNNVDILARKLLKKNAAFPKCIAYKDFAYELNITAPPVIATVTLILETMLEEDVKQKKPLLAALVIQKGKYKIPRPGFFEKLEKLCVIEFYDDKFDEMAWHTAELKKLKAFYTK